MFTGRRGNKSLNFAFIKKQETLKETRNPTPQDIQTPSLFTREEIVETMPTTTLQNISPIHSTLTTLQKKYSISTDNHTTRSKIICCPKKFTNGLTNT